MKNEVSILKRRFEVAQNERFAYERKLKSNESLEEFNHLCKLIDKEEAAYRAYEMAESGF